MNQDIILYTVPQWFVFAAIIASIYGWVEHKKTFRLIGPFIFFLLGIFAIIALGGGMFSTYEYLTPGEIINEEMAEEPTSDVPFQVMLFPAYISFIIAGILAVPAFILEWKEGKWKNVLIILTSLTGLFGFFIIVGALRSL